MLPCCARKGLLLVGTERRRAAVFPSQNPCVVPDIGEAYWGLPPVAANILEGVYGDPAVEGPGAPRIWAGGVLGGSPMESIASRDRATGSLAMIKGGGRRRSSGGWLNVEVVDAILEVDKFLL